MNENIAGIGILIDPLIVGDKIVGISIKIHVVGCLTYLSYLTLIADRASEKLRKPFLAHFGIFSFTNNARPRFK